MRNPNGTTVATNECMNLRLPIIICLVLLARPAVADAEPSALEVQRAALQYHRLNPEEVRRWQRDARRSPWLPRLQIGYDRNIDSKVTLSVDDNASITSRGVIVGPTLSSSDANSQDQNSYDVRAVWSLDELVYNRNQIDLNEEMRQLMRESERIAREVNRIYHGWLEARRRGVVLEVFRLEGELDAMTGGWFTDQLRSGGS